MATFSDFLQSSQATSGNDMKVNDIIKAFQENEGSVQSDVARMLVSVDKMLQQEMSTFGAKDVVNELSKLDRHFADYADNLVMLKNQVTKFTQGDAEVRGEDVEVLQKLLDKNDTLIKSINANRVENKDYNERVLEIGRRNNYEFRRRGIAQEEMDQIKKKHDLSSSELWKGIQSDVEQFKSTVKDDFKKGLIEGVGGPIGVLTRKVFLPGYQLVKDMPIGKIGAGLAKFRTGVSKLFVKNNKQRKEVNDGLKEVTEVSIQKQEQQSEKLAEAIEDTTQVEEQAKDQKEEIEKVGEIIKETSESKDVAQDQKKGIEQLAEAIEDSVAENVLGIEGVTDAISDAVAEIVVPSATNIKRRHVLEERARKSGAKTKEPGVYQKILNAEEQGNVYLSDIVNLLKSQMNQLGDSYESLALISIAGDRLLELEEESASIQADNSGEQIDALKQIKAKTELENRKLEIANRLSQDVFDYEKEDRLEADDDRDENYKVQAAILDELEDLNRKDLGGSSTFGTIASSLAGLAGAGGLMAGLRKVFPKLTNVLGKLGPILGKLGLLFGAVTTVDDFFKGIGQVTGAGGGRLEINPETGKMEYTEHPEEETGLLSMIKGAPKELADFWKGRVQAGEWTGTAAEAAAREREKEAREERFKRAEQTGKAEDIIELSKEDIAQMYDPDNPAMQANLNRLLEDLFGKYTVTPKAVKIGGETYQFNVGAEPEKDEITEQEFIDLLRNVRNVGSAAVEVSNSVIDRATNVNTSAEIVSSELDREMLKVDRESNELSAQSKITQRERVQAAVPTVANVTGATEKKSKQKLDEISLMPEDNFGIVLVNSGLNII